MTDLRLPNMDEAADEVRTILAELQEAIDEPAQETMNDIDVRLLRALSYLGAACRDNRPTSVLSWVPEIWEVERDKARQGDTSATLVQQAIRISSIVDEERLITEGGRMLDPDGSPPMVPDSRADIADWLFDEELAGQDPAQDAELGIRFELGTSVTTDLGAPPAEESAYSTSPDLPEPPPQPDRQPPAATVPSATSESVRVAREAAQERLQDLELAVLAEGSAAAEPQDTQLILALERFRDELTGLRDADVLQWVPHIADVVETAQPPTTIVTQHAHWVFTVDDVDELVEGASRRLGKNYMHEDAPREVLHDLARTQLRWLPALEFLDVGLQLEMESYATRQSTLPLTRS